MLDRVSHANQSHIARSLLIVTIVVLSAFVVIVSEDIPTASAEIFGPNVRADDTGTDPSGQARPSIALSKSGTIYIAWSDQRNDATFNDIYVTSSLDGGETFDKNTRINDNIFPSRQHTVDIATDNSGGLHAVWRDWRNDADGYGASSGGIDGIYNVTIYYSNSTDGGKTWSPNIRLMNGTIGNWGSCPYIAVDSLSTIHVVWGTQEAGTGVGHVLHTRSLDRGKSFSEPKMIDNSSGTASYPSIAVDENDVTYVAWEDDRNSTTGKDIWFVKSTDRGLNFKGHKAIHKDTQPIDQRRPRISARAGMIGVVWYNEPPFVNISFGSSFDGGQSFSNPKVVNDDFSPVWRRWPSLWINETHYISVAWGTERNGNEDIYFANSTDKGQTFSANQRVNDDFGADYQRLADLTMDSNGYVYLVWMDSRERGDFDIYFTRAPPEIADLEPIGMSFTPPSPVTEWTTINLNATIRNNGDRKATNVLVRFFDGDPSLNVQIGADQILPRIDANGGISYAEAQWTATPGGLHTIYVVVDPENNVTESNESNNVLSAVIEVVPPPPEVLPPENLRTSAVGNDVRLDWELPIDISNVSHYLIYRAQDQREFDFLTPIYNTSNDPNQTRTNWTDVGAASSGSPTEYYYTVRTVSTDGRRSITSNTAGKWTKAFSPGLNAFSLPLEPFDGQNVSDYAVGIPNVDFIRWMDSNGHWVSHHPSMGPGINDAPTRMGEGYEISPSSLVTHTFCGSPASMIRFQEGLGDSVIFRKSLSARIEGNDINLSWIAPVGADRYLVFRSDKRGGLHDLSLSPIANTTSIFWRDLGVVRNERSEYYYMVIPMDPLGEPGSGTYSVGAFTVEYQSGSDTFALPLKTVEAHSLDWHCDNIPNVVGMAYMTFEVWKFHAPLMPEGVYDVVVQQGEGFQISTNNATRFVFVGY